MLDIHTEEKPYGKSIHTGEEPYIYHIIIVSLIKSQVHKTCPLSNPLIKMGKFVLLATKFLLIQCLDHLCSFWSVKQMPIFISEQHLYFSWLRILGIQLHFLTSLVLVEHRSMIPLTCLWCTLSQHQNVALLVHLGCKWSAWFSCFQMFIVMILCFFNNIKQDMR